MIKVKVTGSKFSTPIEKDFNSKEDAEKWIQKHSNLGSWGNPDTWIDIQNKEDTANFPLCREIIRETTVSGKIVDKEVIYSCLLKGDYTVELTTILYDDFELNLSKFREKRDALLAKSDKYMLADYPIQAKLRQLIKEYREYLRDCPKEMTKDNVELVKIKTFKEYVQFKHGDIVDSDTRKHYKAFYGL